MCYSPVSCRSGGFPFSEDTTTGSGPVSAPVGSGMSDTGSGPRLGLKAASGESDVGRPAVSGYTGMGSGPTDTGSGLTELDCLPGGRGLVTAEEGSEGTGTGSGPRGLVTPEKMGVSLDRPSERVSAPDETGEPISLVVSEGEKGNSCRGVGQDL